MMTSNPRTIGWVIYHRCRKALSTIERAYAEVSHLHTIDSRQAIYLLGLV